STRPREPDVQSHLRQHRLRPGVRGGRLRLRLGRTAHSVGTLYRACGSEPQAWFHHAADRLPTPLVRDSGSEPLTPTGLYLPPPTTLNFGLATTILAGSDQDICCAPVGKV